MQKDFFTSVYSVPVQTKDFGNNLCSVSVAVYKETGNVWKLSEANRQTKKPISKRDKNSEVKRAMTFNCNLSIICAAVAVVLAGLPHDAESQTNRNSCSYKEIPSHCPCGFTSLSGSCAFVQKNQCYPEHETLNIEGDCLPSVPAK